MFLIDKKVSTEELTTALDELDRLLSAQFPEDRQARALAMSYVIYRGMQAMRDEYAAAYAQFVGAAR
jgi:hypothetical protein